MQRVAVVGLGNMGSGLAKNLIAAGFETTGFDIDPAKLEALRALGGRPAPSPREAAEGAEAAFVMVMDGAQAKAAILGEDGLARGLRRGAIVVLTATVAPAEAREIAAMLARDGIDFVDSPVSGGFAGAQAGTLTVMAAAPAAVLARAMPFLRAVGGDIHPVGEEPGTGQTVKACLQILHGAIFAATFEAAALAAKAGLRGQVLLDVISDSSAGSRAGTTALGHILDRRFSATGSHISTMHKDLAIALELARELGVPSFTAAVAMQLFAAGRTRFPDGDNQAIARLLEELVGAELHR